MFCFLEHHRDEAVDHLRSLLIQDTFHAPSLPPAAFAVPPEPVAPVRETRLEGPEHFQGDKESVGLFLTKCFVNFSLCSRLLLQQRLPK